MPRGVTDSVRAYYDRGTWSFLALGQGRREGVIHRAVWGPGVTTRRAAFHFVHDRMAEALRSSGAAFPQVLDLGCGVGATLLYMTDVVPRLRGIGVTLSPRQVAQAARRIEAAGRADRVQVREADFCALPTDVPAGDAAWAIEALVHAPDPAAFFSGAARAVRSGGRLWICDDVRAEHVPPESQPTLDRFTRGWHAPSLLPHSRLESLAAAAGFVTESVDDLTPWLELGRPRDLVAAVCRPLLERLPFAQARMLVGGSALQTALQRGWVRYLLVTLRRT